MNRTPQRFNIASQLTTTRFVNDSCFPPCKLDPTSSCPCEDRALSNGDASDPRDHWKVVACKTISSPKSGEACLRCLHRENPTRPPQSLHKPRADDQHTEEDLSPLSMGRKHEDTYHMIEWSLASRVGMEPVEIRRPICGESKRIEVIHATVPWIVWASSTSTVSGTPPSKSRVAVKG